MVIITTLMCITMYSSIVTGPAMYPFLSRTVIADSDRHTAMMIKFIIVN